MPLSLCRFCNLPQTAERQAAAGAPDNVADDGQQKGSRKDEEADQRQHEQGEDQPQVQDRAEANQRRQEQEGAYRDGAKQDERTPPPVGDVRADCLGEAGPQHRQHNPHPNLCDLLRAHYGQSEERGGRCGVRQRQPQGTFADSGFASR